MSWIKTIGREQAEGRLQAAYRRIAGADGQIDNIMAAHSLRPHSLEGHMALYKNVLHHSGNTLPVWLLEALGVWVSRLNDCGYCVAHHSAGLRRQLDDAQKAAQLLGALEDQAPDRAFSESECALLDYARALTVNPAELSAEDIERLRHAGWSDGEILEVNQVVAYFAYANRVVLGLGVTPEGETLGLSPHGSDGDWAHE